MWVYMHILYDLGLQLYMHIFSVGIRYKVGISIGYSIIPQRPRGQFLLEDAIEAERMNKQKT